jgi:hypothetical protein
MISPGVSQDQQPRLTESILQLIGEGTRCMPPCNSLAASVLGKLQDRTLSIRPCRLHNNVLGILNGDNHSGCQLQLIPGLANINDENTCKENKAPNNHEQCISTPTPSSLMWV